MNKNEIQNLKKYLPSKKFTYLLAVIIILGLISFTISSLFFGKNSYVAQRKEAKLQNQKITLNNLLQKDTDGDRVMDWEEALWGTDPNKEKTFNDTSDANYIKQKRGDLNLSENTSTQGNDTITETDKFAQQFFASLTAMKQTGGIDQNSIKNVSTALGQNIVDPTLIDQYTQGEIKIALNDGPNEQKTYYTEAKKLFETYKNEGLGDELEIVGTIVSSGTTGNEQGSAERLTKISDAYQGFAKKMIELKVPASLAQYHSLIINSANNTGISVRSMTKIINDPIIGLSGLSQYQKYNDDLITSVINLEKKLSDNGIITQ